MRWSGPRRPWRALSLGAALLVLAGCDFLKGSGTGARVSPFISNLGLSRPSVICDQEFVVSVDYDDPQGDVDLFVLNLQGPNPAATREKRVVLDSHGTSGKVSYTTKFLCTDSGGRWVVTVHLEDARGHQSNSLQSEITLVNAVP